jgi:tRNA threonylcarbamoyladenosine biosynthesis protein TsaB
LLLAIDTASRFISLALHDGHQLHFESTWHTRNNHTIELAPAIRRAFQQTQIGPADLTAVAVSQGPGSFTGLRIGLGVAKGLAMAQNLALVAVPTLEVVAAGVPVCDGALLAVLQAGRGRICAQRFERKDGTWVVTAQAEITDWEHLVSRAGQETLFAGEIDDTGRALLSSTEPPMRIASGAHALRRAGFLAEIAWSRVRSGDTDNPATVTPIYLHQPGVPHP